MRERVLRGPVCVYVRRSGRAEVRVEARVRGVG